MSKGLDRDYELLEEQMNVTATLLDAREAVERALLASRKWATRLETVAMEKRREQRTANDPR